ncbi:MAG: phosphatase PAP2 family protein [Microgenomates group bacterium]
MTLKQWLEFQKEDLIKRIKNYPKRKFLFFLMVCLFSIFSFFLLWKKIFNSFLIDLDVNLSLFFQKNSSPTIRYFLEKITLLGSEFFIMSLSLFLLIFLIKTKRKRAAITVLISLLGSAILLSFFKSFFSRIRPGECPDFLFGGIFNCYSFPSGHSAISFYFYGLITYLIFRFGKFSKKWNVGFSIMIGLLILLIAFSRLYLGVHFLTDVIGGFLLGGFWLTVAIFLIDFLY